MTTVTLYHGTTESHAALLLERGWRPGEWPSGSQCGESRYLCLTNVPENALWYAEQKGDRVVLEVLVPRCLLKVDPHDGICGSLDEELSMAVPGNVVAIATLEPSAFSRPVIAFRL